MEKDAAIASKRNGVRVCDFKEVYLSDDFGSFQHVFYDENVLWNSIMSNNN